LKGLRHKIEALMNDEWWIFEKIHHSLFIIYHSIISPVSFLFLTSVNALAASVNSCVCKISFARNNCAFTVPNGIFNSVAISS
jgi:hypothetical protein